MVEGSSTSPPRLLEVSHVAHRLSVSDEYVLRLIRGKKLPAIRLGIRYRIDQADLEAFIKASRVGDEPDCPPSRLRQVSPPKGAA
jgi:excisionase family DNA binding protein